MKSTLAPGEDYATATQLLAADDRGELLIRVFALPIRVRGLGLEEREEARATSWRADGQRDVVKLIKFYLKHGITTPQMNSAQIDQFVQKHAWAVESVYLMIDRLTELPYDLVVAAALAESGLAPGAEPDRPPGTDGADDRPLDRHPGAGSGDAPADVSQDDRE